MRHIHHIYNDAVSIEEYLYGVNMVTYLPQIGILLSRLNHCATIRAIGQLFKDILHLKELGDTESVVANAVWVFI